MSGKNGYVMIELLLMLTVVSLCTRMCIPMMKLKKRGNAVRNDFQPMSELWQKEQRCGIYCPKREVLPDLVSLR